MFDDAGYGFLGAVKETSSAEVRRMFDAHIFGVWNVLPGADMSSTWHRSSA